MVKGTYVRTYTVATVYVANLVRSYTCTYINMYICMFVFHCTSACISDLYNLHNKHEVILTTL